jgi:hypothetical protein
MVENDVWLIVSDLCSQDITEPCWFALSRRLERIQEGLEIASSRRPRWFPELLSMLSCPRFLHELVVSVNIVCFMPKFEEVPRVEVRYAEKALVACTHLFFVRSFLQPWMPGIKPAQKFRIVGIEDQELQA